MANIVRYDRRPELEPIQMTNGLTSVFIVVLAASRLARTNQEKELAAWIGSRDQSVFGLERTRGDTLDYLLRGKTLRQNTVLAKRKTGSYPTNRLQASSSNYPKHKVRPRRQRRAERQSGHPGQQDRADILALAVRLTRPMPNREPTATWVVDTGNPSRLAPATSRDVARFAVNPWPGFMRVILRLMVSATRRAL